MLYQQNKKVIGRKSGLIIEVIENLQCPIPISSSKFRRYLHIRSQTDRHKFDEDITGDIQLQFMIPLTQDSNCN